VYEPTPAAEWAEARQRFAELVPPTRLEARR
jgi:hypothetical protein